LVEYLSNKVQLPSRRELYRDLEKTFEIAQGILKTMLQEHIKAGGRISLTTDTWSAKNNNDFMAVTVHYIDFHTFENKSYILDVIELKEPVHSGEYICEELLKITDFYSITMAVFTVS
jgi:hypothetical protein